MDGKLWNRTELMEEYFKLSVYSDLSEWQCSSFSKSGGAVSYYSGYDDGTICDCGSPFILHVGVMPPVKWTEELKWTDVMSFRPLNGISPGEWIGNEMIYVKESTGAPVYYSSAEAPRRDLTDSEKSRPADVPPKSSCGQRPDISSLFKINYIYEAGHFNDADTEYVPVQVGSGGCLIDNTFLEHLPIIDNEVREKEAGDPSWCVAKCNANPECAAWTLSKLNGWCTLKTVKGLTTSTFLELKNFMSGLKDCKFKN